MLASPLRQVASQGYGSELRRGAFRQYTISSQQVRWLEQLLGLLEHLSFLAGDVEHFFSVERILTTNHGTAKKGKITAVQTCEVCCKLTRLFAQASLLSTLADEQQA